MADTATSSLRKSSAGSRKWSRGRRTGKRRGRAGYASRMSRQPTRSRYIVRSRNQPRNTKGLVRKQECRSGGRRGKGFRPIVLGENATRPFLPSQKIGILSGEFFPGLWGMGTQHTLTNQKQVRPCDGLVIEMRLPLGGGKSL